MNYDEWIGKSKDQNDSMAPEQLQRFEALMDRDPGVVSAGSELTPCSHWIYFTPMHKQSEIGEDGHAIKGGFLPPVDLPNRMWAGGNLKFKKPLKTSIPADRRSTIVKIDEKDGASGKLCFITVRHQISTSGSLAVDEEQQVVYREATEEGAHPVRTKPMDIDFDWKKNRKLSSVQLFRYSALTYNAHRIHYDQPFATRREGYPNLVVHSPFLLTLMMDLFKTETDGKVIEEIEYQSVGPIFLDEEITITSKDVDNFKAEMRALGPDNKMAMKATVKWTYSWN